MNPLYFFRTLFRIILVIIFLSGRLMAEVVAFDSIPMKDTVLVKMDTLKATVKISENAVKSKVIYSADDSMRFNIPEQKVYLFGNAKVDYEDIMLKAAYIEFDLQENIVYAEGTDSAGTEKGKPLFNDGSQEFTAKNMTYNFKTKKGRVKEVLTREGEGFIHGDSIFKDPDNIFYIKDGKYTTCDQEHPHFAIQSGKLKIIPDDKVVTGPAYLEIADVPTPLALPFGIFPIKKGRSSGVKIPAYGEAQGRGFYLKDGGYYFGFSDYLDLTLLSDIYTNGSWGLKSAWQYNLRYHYNGLLNINYSNLLQGEKGFPDYSLNKDMQIMWKHNQDPKARPFSRFSADVNLISKNYLRYNDYDPEDHLANTISSSVTWSRTRGNHSINAAAGFTQFTDRNSVTIRMPEITYSRSSTALFKKGVKAGASPWYEKIRAGYTMNLKNEINIPDTIIFKKFMQRDIITNSISDATISTNPAYFEQPIRWKNYMRYGIKHTVPVSTSLNVMKFVNFNPSVNFTERWYLSYNKKKWDSATRSIITDTVNRFSRAGDFMVNTPLSTQVYGMYIFKGEKIQAIRHVMTPSIGLSYRPDFSEPFWGYYEKVQKDTSGNILTYSIHENYLYGHPDQGKWGAVVFSLNNNLEMKTKSKRDTINPIKKIKILEGLSFSSSYNLAADSLNWAPVSIAGRTDLFNKVNLTFNGTADPYYIDSNGVRWNIFEYDKTRKPVRLTTASGSVNFRMNSKSRSSQNTTVESTSGNDTEFYIPWSLNVSYIARYSKPAYNDTVIHSLTFSGEMNLTRKWKIRFSSGIDVRNKQLTYTVIDIERDLHCWEMKFHWIPFGNMKSYMLDINVKADVLKELKVTRKKDWSDY